MTTHQHVLYFPFPKSNSSFSKIIKGIPCQRTSQNLGRSLRGSFAQSPQYEIMKSEYCQAFCGKLIIAFKNNSLEAVATYSAGKVLSRLWGKVHKEQNPHMDSNECCLRRLSKTCFLYPLYPDPPLGFPGKCNWRCFDLFGGAHCARQAWRMICAAAHSRWGISSNVTYGFNVTQLIWFNGRSSNFFLISKDGRLCS